MSPKHPDQRDIYAMSNSIFRVSILIHEALHNDDSFDHIECSAIEDEGVMGCDNDSYKTNGMDSVFLLYAPNICGGCSDEGKRILRERGMEYLDRINWPRIPVEKERVMGLAEQMQRDQT